MADPRSQPDVFSPAVASAPLGLTLMIITEPAPSFLGLASPSD